MTEQFANAVTNSLSSDVDAAVTTLPVVSGSVLPATGTFRLSVGTEIMLATSRSGNNVTVVRGTEGSTAAAHLAGAEVVPIWTTAALTQLVADILAAALAAGPGGSAGGQLGGTYPNPTVNHGTSSSTACAGNDARLSDSRAPTGSAGGQLSGSYPNPTLNYGTSSSTACVGNDSRLSDSRAPTGAAGGGLGGTYPNPTVLTPASHAIGSMDIDWSLSGVFSKTLAGGANTFTFSNASDGMSIIVRVTGAASTLAWPSVKWAGGIVPTQTASGTDIYTFVKEGSTIYGAVGPVNAS